MTISVINVLYNDNICYSYNPSCPPSLTVLVLEAVVLVAITNTDQEILGKLSQYYRYYYSYKQYFRYHNGWPDNAGQNYLS